MRRELVAVAVALPVLAIGLAIAKAELQGARSREFVFAIGGYDPVDLLKGHYLQFRLQVNEGEALDACADGERSDCCLCLKLVSRDLPPIASRTTCERARTECHGALPTGYLRRSLRYYVPEAQAADLDRQLAEAMQQQQATALIAIDPSGAVQVREVRLYGVAIPGAVGAR